MTSGRVSCVFEDEGSIPEGGDAPFDVEEGMALLLSFSLCSGSADL